MKKLNYKLVCKHGKECKAEKCEDRVPISDCLLDKEKVFRENAFAKTDPRLFQEWMKNPNVSLIMTIEIEEMPRNELGLISEALMKNNAVKHIDQTDYKIPAFYETSENLHIDAKTMADGLALKGNKKEKFIDKYDPK